jgi:hypothetical protein
VHATTVPSGRVLVVLSGEQVPVGAAWQALPTQTKPVAQLVSEVHAVRQFFAAASHA